jgi:hypothetical protein
MLATRREVPENADRTKKPPPKPKNFTQNPSKIAKFLPFPVANGATWRI